MYERVRSSQGSDGYKGQGMGLGLAITAEISALFGADLDLTAGRGGAGLLARVRFPAAAGSVPAQPGV